MQVLIIGSSVIDLFLKVDPHHVSTADNAITMKLGDKIPTDMKTFAIGGNGANVSTGLTRLEIPATFYTFIGKDLLSREIEEKLSAEGVEVVSHREKYPNAPLHIIIDFDTDRIILSHYEKQQYEFMYENPHHFDYMYLTSIPDHWEDAYRQILDFAQKNSIPIAFSPGTRQLETIDELFLQVMKQTKLFFSNKDEAKMILKTENDDMEQLLQGIKELGPQVVSITDGPNKSWAIDENNMISSEDPIECQASEKTGAGDGYAAAFFAAVLNQKDVQTAMKWGRQNACAVMQKVGAQEGLLTKKQMDDLLSKEK